MIELLAKKSYKYHECSNKRPFFEGWYFKHVSSKYNFVIAIICAVSRSKDETDDHCFIQIITEPQYKSYYIRFGIDEFKYNKKCFEVQIGKNFFSQHHIYLDIKNDDIEIKADLHYNDHLYLDYNVFSPTIMGPFSYLPNMQCRHGVLSLQNRVSGEIILGDILYDMNDATGYIEKDWGRTFPESYIWLQGSTEILETKRITFMCSIANIPLGSVSFIGLIANITIDDKQYRFATYNGAKIVSINKIKNGIEIVLKRNEYMLYIKAISKNYEALIAPSDTGMDRKIYESISAEINLKLMKDKKILYKDILFDCGMEISELKDLEINNEA
jgi:hypothetical protein